MKKMIVTAAIACALVSCSEVKKQVQEQSAGNVTVAVSMPESGKSRATKASKLHIRIVSDLGAAVCDTVMPVSAEMTLLQLTKLQQGTGYSGSAWTTDDKGDTIHGAQTKTFSVIPNEQTSLIFSLAPICGSIIVHMIDVPGTTDKDSAFLIFTSDQGTFSAREGRSSKMSLELDKVPYGARGKLHLFTLKPSRDTSASWDTTFTFTNQSMSAQFSFMKTGNFKAEVTMTDPVNTVFTGIGDANRQIASESGKLIVTEFTTQGGDMIEIYNPGTAVFSEEITLVVESKSYKLQNVSIPAGGFYLITGPDGGFWGADTTLADFTLVAASGYFSISSGGVTHDNIIYFNDLASGWQSTSSTSKRSYELKSGSLSAAQNNMGSSWKTSTVPVPGKTDQWGSPRSL